jgi:hypothetical protein
LNPRLIKPFEKTYKEKQKELFDKSNMESWLNGLYMAHAIGSCFSKENKYPEKPLEFSTNKDDNQSMEDHVANFTEFAMAFNVQRNKKNRTSVERQESDGDTDGSGQT